MLKTQIDDTIRLVQQPHHAEISGYLAAHWGGVNGFARPGHYPGATEPALWREEVVVGIAEHDNGWWEWEATPRFSPNDGLPVGLGERVDASQQRELEQWRRGGFDRWRKGIERLAGAHPYGALMVSLHAYWLYAVEFDELAPGEGDAKRHFIFSGKNDAPPLVSNRTVTRAFLEEQRALQATLRTRLAGDARMAGAERPDHLDPHLRLLQLFDAMSLRMALNDPDDYVLEGVPRSAWGDRVSVEWRRTGMNTIAIAPYPFDMDPLPVAFPARIVSAGHDAAERRLASPNASLLGVPYETVTWHLTRGE